MKKIVIGLLLISMVLLSNAVVQARPIAQGTVHIVQPGDTMFSIARRYGVDVTALARANNILNPNHIYVGQRLVVPSGNAAPPAVGNIYVVKAGDTLYSIARYYGTTAWAIAQANGLYNLNHIYIGQRLQIPGAAPAATPRPTTVAPPSTSTAWQGEYYVGKELAGSPLFVRNDAAVNFQWGQRSPDTRLNTDQFSVRWTRTINFQGGLYRFTVTADDGARIWVDGVLALDAWGLQPGSKQEVDITLTAGSHLVVIDYFEDTGAAAIQFSFKRLGAAPVPTATPSVTFTPTPGSSSTPGATDGAWLGEYFGNRDLSGTPTVTRMDSFIGFEWNQAAPMDGIPSDGFSARWTRKLWLYEDNYAFCARADDGVRVTVNGQRIIDEWHGSPGYPNYCVEVEMLKGTHTLQVEYYEDGGNALIYVWWERR
ncbi:MAG TPA: PA14 domain-containing protein [Anaerolineae bacterium]|nr:PA14 domain-containing protein [Anaerolineae bacterium]